MAFTLSSLTQNPKKLLLLIVSGGIGLAACDQIHVQFDVLKYFHKGPWGQAWWVAPQFVLATFLMYIGAVFFKKEKEVFELRNLFFGILWFGGAYFASGLFSSRPYFLAFAYSIVWVFRIFAAREKRTLVAFSLLLAVAGTTAEALISYAGFFAYTRPDVFLVPIWLPGLYLHGAPLIWNLVTWTKR